MADAFNVNFLGVHPEAVRQRGEDADFVLGVPTVDVEVRRGFGVTLLLRIGVKVGVRKVAVKAFDEPRPYEIPRAAMTTDWREVVNDPDVHVVAELVGGTNLAKEIILSALKLGKPVITANKALLSKHGEELFAAAKSSSPCSESSALFAVMTGLPSLSADKMISFAKVVPPTSSATT